MRRFVSSFSALLLVIASAAFSGCGGGGDDGQIQDTPEAIAADQAGQKAMEDFMKSQQAGAPK